MLSFWCSRVCLCLLWTVHQKMYTINSSSLNALTYANVIFDITILIKIFRDYAKLLNKKVLHLWLFLMGWKEKVNNWILAKDQVTCLKCFKISLWTAHWQQTVLTPVPASPGGPGFPASPGSPYEEDIEWVSEHRNYVLRL